jgi:S-formylglutathione hydrolase
LIGPTRDPSPWESNNPANRARANAQQIRDSGLAIYLDAAERDFLNAYDGAEFLHRELWDLDLSALIPRMPAAIRSSALMAADGSIELL